MPLPPLELELRFRAGVLGMPGRCSHEKGTAEARSGDGRNRWNGDGDLGGNKENGDAAGGACIRDGDGEWWWWWELLGFPWRRRRRRRGVATAEGGVAGAGVGRDGEAGIGAGLWWLLDWTWWWCRGGGELGSVGWSGFYALRGLRPARGFRWENGKGVEGEGIV